MNRLLLFEGTVGLLLGLLFTSCGRKTTAQDNRVASPGPVPIKAEPETNSTSFKVAHPERFPLVTAGEHVATPELNVTGVVSPDVSRQVPVPSLATGRVVELDARLGDTVQRRQLLFKVRSTDIAGAYSDYRKAVRNEQLAKLQLERAKLLFADGAIPKSALETAQTTEDNALVDVETATEHLRLLGADPNHPSGIIEVRAPVAGVITEQQITNQSGVQALAAPNPFTISNMSHVWIVCDVYENNLAQVYVGEHADVHLAAYPNRVLKGRISNIMPIIDPNIRTAKVRLEVENPGVLKLGMFVTATFHGQTAQRRATLPATAVLRLHDSDWVFRAFGNGSFRQVEVQAGSMGPDGRQEFLSGLAPGDEVVANALQFSSAAGQQ
jgi:membrane fusion protein, heavy metal efflux system